MVNNPLSEFYTQTGMFVSLPSNGRFYTNKIKTSADGDVEIFPMNAVDEMQFQNPDGLLNNESLVNVFKRVLPGIPDPNEIPKPDLDVLLLALRMVTYGKNLEIETVCEKCKHKAEYSVDLSRILASAKKIIDDNTVTIGELVLNLKPFNLSSQNRMNEYMISIQRAARQLQLYGASPDSNDIALFEKIKTEMTDNVRRSSAELFQIASASIESIILPNGDLVTDQQYISEWLDNIKAPDYKKIREKITELSEEPIDREVKFVCEKCQHENVAEVQFDPANFFDTSSG